MSLTATRNANDHVFLFASLDSKKPSTTRKIHIRRLYDILQLSVQRNDFQRAKRAWAILARCKEVHWWSLWATGLLLLGEGTHHDQDDSSEKLEYLRSMMLRHKEERETILKELILHLIFTGKYQDALDELELYLPSSPYQDNPVLHIYAGLICLYLSQPMPSAEEEKSSFDPISLRSAQTHLNQALTLDPENEVATSFLNKIREVSGTKVAEDSEDEEMDTENSERPQKSKRLRKR